MRAQFSLIILVFGLFCTVLSSCKEDQENVQILRLDQPPYAGLTDSIKQFPDRVELYLSRALLLSQNNQHEAATPDYKKAWEMSTDEMVAIEYAANLQLTGNLKNCMVLLQECQQKFPDNAEFTRRISELYALAGKRKEAVAEYDKILARDSANFMVLYDKGILLAKLGDTVSAIQTLERSYLIQPLTYTGLALANIYSMQQNPRILQICDDIIKKDTTAELVDAVFLKGIYFSDIKEYSKALQQFEECIKRDWKFTDAHIEKGIVYFEKKDYKQALEVFKLAATVSNTNADTYYWIGKCQEAMKNMEEAIQYYERAYSLDPDMKEAREAIQRLK